MISPIQVVQPVVQASGSAGSIGIASVTRDSCLVLGLTLYEHASGTALPTSMGDGVNTWQPLVVHTALNAQGKRETTGLYYAQGVDAGDYTVAVTGANPLGVGGMSLALIELGGIDPTGDIVGPAASAYLTAAPFGTGALAAGEEVNAIALAMIRWYDSAVYTPVPPGDYVNATYRTNTFDIDTSLDYRLKATGLAESPVWTWAGAFGVPDFAFAAAGLLYERAKPTFVGQTSSPADNGPGAGDVARPVFPVPGMVAGDLVVLLAQYRGTIVPRILNAAGQDWITAGTLTDTNLRVVIYWATFNGNWPSTPSVIASGGTATTPLSARMAVFRPTDPQNIWAIDAPLFGEALAPPSTPFTMTIPGVMAATEPPEDPWEFEVTTGESETGRDFEFEIYAEERIDFGKTVAIALWGTDHDNTFSDLTVGWEFAGPSQIRNSVGAGATLGLAYKLQRQAADTRDVSVNQATNGGDRFVRGLMVFAERRSGSLLEYSGVAGMTIGVAAPSSYAGVFSYTGAAGLTMGALAPQTIDFRVAGSGAILIGVSSLVHYAIPGAFFVQGVAEVALGISASTGYRATYRAVGSAGVVLGAQALTDSPGAGGIFVGSAGLTLGVASPIVYSPSFSYVGAAAIALGMTALTSTYFGNGPPHTITILQRQPSVTVRQRTPTITISRNPMGIVEQTTVTLTFEFRDKTDALTAPSSATYWMHEKESTAVVIPSAAVPNLGQTAQITIPAAKLAVPDYENERVFVVVVKAIFGNSDQVTQIHEITARRAPGI